MWMACASSGGASVIFRIFCGEPEFRCLLWPKDGGHGGPHLQKVGGQSKKMGAIGPRLFPSLIVNLDFVIVNVTCRIPETNEANFRKNVCNDIEKNCNCWEGGSVKLTNFSSGFSYCLGSSL